MSDFSNIIQEINTNIPDNNSQSITAKKVRDTLIDLTNAIETQQDNFESSLIVDNLNTSSSGVALSAAQGVELKQRTNRMILEGNNNTLVTQKFYCQSGHTYLMRLSNSSPNWSNITYTTNGYVLFKIANYNVDNSSNISLANRGCDDKINPLLENYIVTPSLDGNITVSCRFNIGETITIYIDDITDYLKNAKSILDLELVSKTNIDIEPIDQQTGKFFNGSIGNVIYNSNSSTLRAYKYEAQEGDIFFYSAKFSNGVSNVYSVYFIDENGLVISQHCKTTSSVDTFNTYLVAPIGTVAVCVNWQSTYSSSFQIKKIDIDLSYSIEDINNNISDLYDTVSDLETIVDENTLDIDDINNRLMYVSEQNPLEYDITISNAFYKGNVGEIITSQTTSARIYGHRYSVSENSTYLYKNKVGTGISALYTLFWTDSEQRIISRHFYTYSGQIDEWNEQVISPEGAAYAFINYVSEDNLEFDNLVYSDINVVQMKEDVDELKAEVSTLTGTKDKLMKVVIRAGFSPTNYSWENAYYIRTKYNDTEDIIIQNGINKNYCLNFNSVYVGPNTLTDDQLRTSNYLVVNCSDSTAPMYHSELYWHLYAQHGVPIPVINNNVSMTSASVGTLWKDTITVSGTSVDRQYYIGNVSNTKIWLLPVFYEDSFGRMTRDWKSTESPAITYLEFVDSASGTDEGISSITVSGYGQEQKFPIMKTSSRTFVCDNTIVTGVGTYYCDDFSVSETQTGFDPASIPNDDWFSSNNDRIDLTNANELVKFTWSYTYKGYSCAMNTTVKFMGDFACQSYGAIQQQYFHSLDNYTAKFMIPKLKTYNVPFEELNSTYTYYRTTNFLVNVDDLVDRQIGWLVNTNENKYRIGLAAGLSLVSGDTVKEKRNQNIPIGSTNAHWRLGSISPNNTNKFYIAAVNTSPFADEQYNFPDGYIKEINTYVSYFDPSQNNGQVYWYKDGNNYIIYCHSQIAVDNLAIQVPSYMEGYKLSVIEKTEDAELITSTITNGKFYIDYSGNGQSKYIVLKAE